jgi:hypothetical protein
MSPEFSATRAGGRRRRHGLLSTVPDQISPFADAGSVGGYLEFETATYRAVKG